MAELHLYLKQNDLKSKTSERINQYIHKGWAGSSCTEDNTVLDVNKEALATAENKPLNIQGQEQGSRTNLGTQPRISPKDLKKKAFDVEKIWELIRFNLYNGRAFNKQNNIDSKELLELWLEQAAEDDKALKIHTD